MTIAQLRIFCHVADSLNMTKTARYFDLTQPAVSAAIRELQAELGQAFFEQRKNKLFLTECGAEFRKKAEELISHFDAVYMDAMEQKDGEKKIKLALCGAVRDTMLPIVKSLKQAFPERDVQCTVSGDHSVLEMMKNGMCDMAVAILPQDELGHMYVFDFGEVRYYCFIPESLRQFTEEEISLADLKGLPLALLGNETANAHYVKKKMPEQLKADLRYRVDSSRQLYALIMEGLAYSFCWEMACNKLPDIPFYRLAEDDYGFHLVLIAKNQSVKKSREFDCVKQCIETEKNKIEKNRHGK